MVKKVDSAPVEFPYAEIIIRGWDSRPIVIRSPLSTGMVDVSPGTAEDAKEARLYLEMIVQVLTAVESVRKLKEASEMFKRDTENQDNDIPF